jgi:hypothetical protein
LKGRDREEYVDVTRLDNADGSGWLPENLRIERDIMEQTAKFLIGDPQLSDRVEFERKVAGVALARLKEIR